MDRRTFLRAALAAGAEALAADLNELLAAALPPATLAVAVDPSPGAATEKALALLGGMGTFVPRGSTVVVKPNIGWDRTPEQGANTHPAVVAAVVRACLAAGAGSVKVFDRSCNDPRLTYQSSGIQAAVEAIGDRRAEVFIPDNRRYIPVDVRDGRAIRRWGFYEDAIRADVVLNLPVLKHHGLTRLTAGLKNLMGILGGNRGEIHQDFGRKIVDVNTVVRPRLTILDASRILTRRGPQGGNLSDVRRADTVVAGADPVAVDAYGAKLFGVEPRELDWLVEAAGRGLGTMDLDRVEVLKG